MTEAISTSEMSLNSNKTTRHNIPEDSHLHTHHCENLKYTFLVIHMHTTCLAHLIFLTILTILKLLYMAHIHITFMYTLWPWKFHLLYEQILQNIMTERNSNITHWRSSRLGRRQITYFPRTFLNPVKLYTPDCRHNIICIWMWLNYIHLHKTTLP
jgi:hypothetical protein